MIDPEIAVSVMVTLFILAALFLLLVIFGHKNPPLVGFLLGVLVTTMISYFAGVCDWGWRVDGMHIHHFYYALVGVAGWGVVSLLWLRGMLRVIPEWGVWFVWGILVAAIVSEVIFVGQYGLWGYLFV